MATVLFYCSVVRCGLYQPIQSSIATWVVAIDGVGGYVLGNIKEYAVWGIVNNEALVELISLWSCLWIGMFQ
jgi:hypothetical protein